MALRSLVAITALGSALAVLGCADAEARPPGGTPGETRGGDRTVRVGEEFTLAPGNAARTAGGFAVRFAGVAEDGRCPREVQCVWEGDAAVTVEITAAGASPVVRELHTGRRFAAETTVGGRTVRLLGLSPAARRDGVPAARYRARLTIG
ncbi:hypothetical protein [Actinomadura algeriensis]|uniref:Lipoprotein n=1 Tax=Actinomadura algeriensis TaxID=1679523 RepID=A0ABR9K361_9ACTN|nr:hypothetical protein [Actinomadura algeriensis]MBE1537296.1 hypothetical protein [Actinomadura algeriensis]